MRLHVTDHEVTPYRGQAINWCKKVVGRLPRLENLVVSSQEMRVVISTDSHCTTMLQNTNIISRILNDMRHGSCISLYQPCMP